MEETKKIDLKSHKLKTHNLRKVLPFYAKYKGMLITICILFVVAGSLGIFGPIFSAKALANLAETEFELAVQCALVTAGLQVVRTLFHAWCDYLYIKINLSVQYDLTDRLIRSVNQTKMARLESVKIGALAERLGADINTVGNSYLQMIDMIFEIITNTVFLIYIGTLNIFIFLVLLIYVSILYVICIYKARVWIRGRKIMKESKDKYRSSYFEQIAGIRDVKLLNIKENITSYSNKLHKDTIKMDIKVNNTRNLIRRIQAVSSILFGLLFIVLGVVFVRKDLLLLSGFLVIYSYYGRVEGLVQYVSSLKENNAEGEIAATRIFEVIENYEKETYGTEELENFSGRVKMEDVLFGYDKQKPVLKNLNMEFLPGQMTAIVGKSGSGKTTILSLISKLYDIDAGAIYLDDKEINSLSEEAIHSNIGVVSQSPYIFNTTIRQNLLFVRPDASEEEIVGALKDAQIYSDIKKLENGIDSEIGENGIKLSGGQKQRIAIARLLLMNSKVIVFDEATSALDNSSQNKIVQMLETFKKDKTIIIVAHRLSTIVGADKIYMIDDGENIASGSHKELMRTCESYKELYELEEKNAKIDNEN